MAQDSLVAMARLLRREIKKGIEVQASLEAANKAVGTLGKVRTEGSTTFNVIRQSSLIFLALTVAKIMERPSGAKSDVASIPVLMRRLKEEGTQARLIGAARRWLPDQQFADHQEKSCRQALDLAIESYDRLEAGQTLGEVRATLQQLRNREIAHLLLKPPRAGGVRIADVFDLLALAREIVTHANFAIDGGDPDFEIHAQEHKRVAEAFWVPALAAVAAYEAPDPHAMR
ncbi:AbiU2 domain-containing protein [Methylopila sp. Yamaguchi]|uniref:AbiU2 domain-containing protein n=1 Tax=Methylopila sp. Yamaguchi TaxID=1437817 RepID=UPI000CCA132C|nr:hypothetical protein [Methylopila sp. Yamaguchi]GBD48132.1 hypothetical protein METY_1345 [Methylopila sp. Yamaguchi]